MNKRIAAGIAAAMLFGMLPACRGASGPPPDEVPVSALEWHIFSDGYRPDKALNNYPLVSRLLSKQGVQVNISFYPRTGNDVRISTLIASKTLPDLLTFEHDDHNSLKLVTNGLALNIRTLSQELYDSIPADIASWYRERDGELYAVPGGYGGAARSVEGLFVREAYYDIIGRPDMSTSRGFAEALTKFTRSADIQNNLSQSFPVIFGKNLSGIRTLEHIFGVYPSFVEGNYLYHRIFSEGVLEVAGFLSDIASTGAYSLCDFDAVVFDTIMSTDVFACFAQRVDIERFNRAHPDAAFISVPPPLSSAGFYEGESSKGNFKTYISSASAMAEKAAGLLLALSTDEASRQLMYGVEDRHWIQTGHGLQTVQYYADRFASHPSEAYDLGIAVFPFLSRIGYVNPYAASPGTKTADILPYSYLKIPTDYNTAYIEMMDQRLFSYYNDCIMGERTAVSVEKEINTLRKDNFRPLGLFSDPAR